MQLSGVKLIWRRFYLLEVNTGLNSEPDVKGFGAPAYSNEEDF